jgi:hypothetical protein
LVGAGWLPAGWPPAVPASLDELVVAEVESRAIALVQGVEGDQHGGQAEEEQ